MEAPLGRGALTHEPGGSDHSPLLDSQIDVHNNDVGIALAADLWRRDIYGRDHCKRVCRNVLEIGRLRMANPDGSGTIISTADWRAYPHEAWRGMRFDGTRPAGSPPPPPPTMPPPVHGDPGAVPV